MRVELLEGERVHRTVRPSRLARLDDYAPTLALVAWAGLLALLYAMPPGQALTAFLDEATGPLAVPLLLVVWWLGLAACTLSFSLRRASPWPAAYGVVVAVVGGMAAIVAVSANPSARDAAALLPWLTLATAPGPTVVAEFLRRSPTWILTDLRLVAVTGILRRHEASWRLPRVEKVRAEPRGPRRLDFGDLIFGGKDGDIRLAGVRPLGRLRDEVELLLHTSPEAPYLADQRDTADKVARLLRPGDAPPRS
jgi:hypothetical protein